MKKRARTWLLFSLLFLVLIAAAGTLLRYMAFAPFDLFPYKNLLHSHSHVAMLGWIYGAVFTGFLYTYLPNKIQEKKIYNILYWSAQATVAGMLVTFIIGGYYLWSIIFSSLHIIIYYWIIIRFYSDIKAEKDLLRKHRLSLMYHFAGLLFMAISTIGPWSLGFIAANEGAGSDLYFQSIYFYLHFQYNGLFTFALLGFLIYLLEQKNLITYNNITKSVFWTLAVATVFAYALSLLGFDIPGWLIGIAFLAGLFQLVAAAVIYFQFIQFRKNILSGQHWLMPWMFAISIFSFIVKFIMQFISGIPALGSIAFESRDIVIGYLHIVMLGMMTCGLIFYHIYNGLLNIKTSGAILGIVIFVIGFLLNELELFANGFFIDIYAIRIPFHNILLFIYSLLMLVGLTLLYLSQVIKKSRTA